MLLSVSRVALNRKGLSLTINFQNPGDKIRSVTVTIGHNHQLPARNTVKVVQVQGDR